MSADGDELLSTAEVDAGQAHRGGGAPPRRPPPGALAKLGGGTWAGDELRRALHFDHFRAAFAFLTEVARLAEEHDHHPELRSSHRDVELRLTTHSAGGLTTKDLCLALEIEGLLRTGES